MLSSATYKTIDDFVTHKDYLTYMYGDVAGLIARGVIPKERKGAYYEGFNFAERLITQNRYFGVADVYTSMNTFLTRHKKHDDNSGRKVSNIKRLNALYLDLDCYKVGLSQDDVLEELEKRYFGTKIPIPTFVINSGRGLYLIWKINEDRNALPRWTSVQNYLFEQCKDFNADPKALDAARILRVPNSINSNNGETVRIMRFNNVKYTLYELIKQYNITPRKKNKKTGNQVTYPYGQATERQRKVAQWQSEAFGVSIPDFTNYQETFDFIHENSRVQQKINNNERRVTRKTDMAATLEGRVSDLFKLFSMRKGVDCCREIGLFLCRLWTAERTNDFAFALEQTKALNRSFDVPFEDKYVETRTKSAETILKKGNTYRYSLSNLLRFLCITEAEQHELNYLCRRTPAQIERRRESNRAAYIARLREANKAPKKETMQARREQIALLLAEGVSKEQICSQLQLSSRTFDRDKAFILAQGLLEWAKSRVAEAAKHISEAIKDVAETFDLSNSHTFERTLKNAQGTTSPFFKLNYYRRTPIGRSANAYSLVNNIFIEEPKDSQITWDDILGALFNITGEKGGNTS